MQGVVIYALRWRDWEPAISKPDAGGVVRRRSYLVQGVGIKQNELPVSEAGTSNAQSWPFIFNGIDESRKEQSGID